MQSGSSAKSEEGTSPDGSRYSRCRQRLRAACLKVSRRLRVVHGAGARSSQRSVVRLRTVIGGPSSACQAPDGADNRGQMGHTVCEPPAAVT